MTIASYCSDMSCLLLGDAAKWALCHRDRNSAVPDRGVPPFGAWFGAGAVGGGRATTAQSELGEDVPHMIFDGLAADGEALADLPVGERLTARIEHLGP